MSGVQRPVSPKARLNYKPAYFPPAPWDMPKGCSRW